MLETLQNRPSRDVDSESREAEPSRGRRMRLHALDNLPVHYWGQQPRNMVLGHLSEKPTLRPGG